jgi:N6-adenosine-specific RNA methylase IME4
VLEGRAVLAGLYRTLIVDCPWQYHDRPPSGVGAQQKYHGMSIEDLCKLPVSAHVTKDAAMGFWVPAPLLGDDDDGVPGWYRVVRAWDFTPKAQIIWDKAVHNYGHYVSVRHELFVICTRGKCTPDRLTPMIDSVYTERPTDHSAKPEWFRKTMERLWDGPYLELFGREPRDGWVVWGDDAKLWPSQTEATA